MTKSTRSAHIQTAQEALRTLLKTLTGTSMPLEAAPPIGGRFGDELREEVKARFVLHDAEHGVVVVLTPAWVPLLSEAMLGEAMEADADASADLMQEIAAQGFGVVQTALAAEGLDVPALTFEAMLPGQEVPALSGEGAWQVPFSVGQEGADLSGFVLMPPTADVDDPADADQLESSEQPPAEQPPAASPPHSEASAPGARAANQAQTPSNEPAPVEIAPAAFADLGSEHLGDGGGPENFDLLAEVNLEVTVELGRRHLPLADVLKLTTGSVVELEKLVGEPLSVYANGRRIAEGEAVVIGEQFGVRITSLATEDRRDKAIF